MIIETKEINGVFPAIKGMRNPMDSWDKSDSRWLYHDDDSKLKYEVGEADKDLSVRLQQAGPEHCKHLRMIFVWADITAPLYWWKQMDCYRYGVEKISTSTMHTLMKRPFEYDDFEFSGMPGYHVIPHQFIPPVDKQNEQWVEVDGYKVSNQGRIIGKHGNETFGVLHKDGYRFVHFNRRIVPIHRVIAKCFCEGYSEDKQVDHIDGNKQNNKAENLEWVTAKENIARSIINGLQPKQRTTYSGKFSKEEREEIIELFETKEYSKREIAKMCGVSHSCICSIINEKYKYDEPTPNLFHLLAVPIINELNRLREEYLASDDLDERAGIWRAIIQTLPESYLQKRTVCMSYAALRNIVKQREGHKLIEWKQFIDWAHTLDNSWMIFE